MITINFILIHTGNGSKDTVTISTDAVPSVHEFVRVSGILYRVEDVTHDVETRSIEVRAVA